MATVKKVKALRGESGGNVNEFKINVKESVWWLSCVFRTTSDWKLPTRTSLRLTERTRQKLN